MRIVTRCSRLVGGGLAGGLGLLFIASVAAIPASVLAASSDADLLKELEGEAQKIGGGGAAQAPAGEKPGGEAGAKGNEGGEFRAGLSQEEFTKALKDAYSGTHAFYLKLPPNVRDEVYRDYTKGASIEQIRAKISERTMHR